MTVFLNGKFVPEAQAVVSVFDRGFLYGDGLFETIRVYHGRPFRWARHVERLQNGARLLKLTVPFRLDRLAEAALRLIAENGQTESVLRITLTRGPGPRGYSPKHAPLIGFFSLIGGYPTGAVDGYQFTEFDPRTDIHDSTTGERYPFFPAIWPSPPRFGLDNGRLVFNGVFGHELMKGLPTAPR